MKKLDPVLKKAHIEDPAKGVSGPRNVRLSTELGLFWAGVLLPQRHFSRHSRMSLSGIQVFQENEKTNVPGFRPPIKNVEDKLKACRNDG